METLLVVVISVISSVGGVAFCSVGFVIGRSLYYEWLLGPGLKRDLGFRLGSDGLPANEYRSYITASAIKSVVEGGVFEQAGFRAGDVLPDLAESTLFEQLHRRRGREAELAVVDGGPGPPFTWRPRRVIRFVVPGRGQRP